MKSIGPLYVDKVVYNILGKKPLSEIGWSQETEEPFRTGKCLVLRVPLTKLAFAFGIWGPPAFNPDEALGNILGSRILDVELDEVRYW
jgi:hypothetical protein